MKTDNTKVGLINFCLQLVSWFYLSLYGHVPQSPVRSPHNTETCRIFSHVKWYKNSILLCPGSPAIYRGLSAAAGDYFRVLPSARMTEHLLLQCSHFTFEKRNHASYHRASSWRWRLEARPLPISKVEERPSASSTSKLHLQRQLLLYVFNFLLYLIGHLRIDLQHAMVI